METAALILTGISAGAKIISGFQQAGALEAQAKEREFQGRVEALRAKEQATSLRENLQRDLASANATFAARGVLTTSGTPQHAMIESREAATRDIDIARFGGLLQQGSASREAFNLRGQKRGAIIGGLGSAAGSLMDMGIGSSVPKFSAGETIKWNGPRVSSGTGPGLGRVY